MNVKMSVFVICVKVIIYLLLYNFHDCTFKSRKNVMFRLFTNIKRYKESKDLKPNITNYCLVNVGISQITKF